MNRIDRLSAIITLLQSSSVSVRPKQITERFGIGIRTLYRDIRALEETGVPIVGDSRTGYSLVDGYKLPPLMFTEEEAIAFLAAERLVHKFTDDGLRESYKSGINKIRAVMRVVDKETISAMDDKIGGLDFHTPSLLDGQDFMQLLLSGISKKKQIEIRYLSHSKNEETKRIVDPIGIFFSMANWYLVAFCHQRNEYRTFRVGRMKQIRIRETYISQEYPSLESFLEELKGKTSLHKAIIEVNRDDLPLMDESKYYQGLVAEIEKGDRIELRFMTFSLKHLARWYLSYADIATICYPDDLEQVAKGIVAKSKIK